MTKIMTKDLESVHKLCEVTLENCIRFADVIRAQGIGVSIAKPMFSCTVVSPKHFRQFSALYLQRLINFIKSKAVKTLIHIGGKTNGIWKDITDINIDTLSIDNVVVLKIV